MDNYEAVLEFFGKSDRPVKAADIANALGIDKKEVDKAMTRLKKEGRIVSPKVCFWEIKK